MKSALLVIDFINEIVAAEGMLGTKGYHAFIEENKTIEKLNEQIAESSQRREPVVFVQLGFSENWEDQPKASPLFGKAHTLGILRHNTWSTDIHKDVLVPTGAIFLTKARVSAFYATPLEMTLRALGVEKVRIAGVATDLAVEATARDAHDRDFRVEVAGSASAAASLGDHARALSAMSKFATIIE